MLDNRWAKDLENYYLASNSEESENRLKNNRETLQERSSKTEISEPFYR